MKQLKQLFPFFAIFLLLATALPAGAETAVSDVYASDDVLVVDNSNADCDDQAGTPFCTIQAAVDVAAEGAVIQVMGNDFDNVYHETVVIERPNLTLLGDEFPVITALSEVQTAVTITADNITFQRFALGFSQTGLVLAEVEGADIAHNLISHNFEAGVVAAGGQQNVIRENLASWQRGPGFLFIEEMDGLVEGNTAVFNYIWPAEDDGAPSRDIGTKLRTAASEAADLVTVQASLSTQTIANVAANDLQSSLLQAMLDDTPVPPNALEDPAPSSGIILYKSSGMQLLANSVAGNHAGGILLIDAHRNHLEANEVHLNALFGIGLGAAQENIVRANALSLNFGWAGIWAAEESNHNVIEANSVVFHDFPFLEQVPFETGSILVASDHNEILANEIGFGDHHGVVVYGQANQISQNEAVGNGHRHFARSTASSRQAGSANSHTYRRSGFYIVGTQNVLQHNVASLNGRHGFELQGHDNRMEANEAWSNRQDGFRIGGEANVVTNNAGFFNRGFGFHEVGANQYNNNQCGNNRLGSDPIACIE